MNSLRLPVIALALFAATTAFAQEQRKIAPEVKAASDKMWATVLATPALPMEKIELHPKVMLEGISAVAADKQGNVYVIHRPTAKDADPIVKVNAKGELVASWGKGMYVIPHGIRIDPQGNVWTTDANTSKVFKYTPDGKQLMMFEVGDVPDAKRPFCSITDIAFSPKGDGHIFIGDGYCNARVLEYDAAGKRVAAWGKAGTGPGEFRQVHSLGIGADGKIYVDDRQNGRIQWFDLTGKFLGEHKFGIDVTSIGIGPSGEIYASTHPVGVPLEQDNVTVKVDPKTGKFLGHIETRAHQIGVGPDGTFLPATRDSQLVMYRPKK
jgi:DNA-binding beta-propeller fold protein YncE